MTKSVFIVNNYEKTVFGHLKKINQNNSSCSNINNLLLSDPYKLIYYYINEYILGNFDNLINKLTLEEYTKISLDLYKLKHTNDKTYEIYRTNLLKTLEVIYQSIIQYKEYIKIRNNYLFAQEKLKILNNIDELKEYLKKLMSGMQILPDISVKAPVYLIKPEILKYIQLYGYPSNNLFDPDKLAEIVNSF
jgi:hypothetical protein